MPETKPKKYAKAYSISKSQWDTIPLQEVKDSQKEQLLLQSFVVELVVHTTEVQCNHLVNKEEVLQEVQCTTLTKEKEEEFKKFGSFLFPDNIAWRLLVKGKSGREEMLCFQQQYQIYKKSNIKFM